MKTRTSFLILLSLGLRATFVVGNVDGLSRVRVKRDLQGCRDTYGPVAQVCGDVASSGFCYNPEAGETCCLIDNSYCNATQYCAPVAGFCCDTGEDVASCAQRLDFTLPTASTTDAIATIEAAPAASTTAIITLPHPTLPHLSVPPIGLIYSTTDTPAVTTPSSSGPEDAITILPSQASEPAIPTPPTSTSPAPESAQTNSVVGDVPVPAASSGAPHTTTITPYPTGGPMSASDNNLTTLITPTLPSTPLYTGAATSTKRHVKAFTALVAFLGVLFSGVLGF